MKEGTWRWYRTAELGIADHACVLFGAHIGILLLLVRLGKNPTEMFQPTLLREMASLPGARGTIGETARREGSGQATRVVDADKSAQGGEAKQTATGGGAAAAGGSAGKSGDGDGEGRAGGKEEEGQGGVESEGMGSGARGEGERVQVRQGGGKTEKATGGGETEGGGGSVVEEGKTEEKGEQGGEDVKGCVLPPTHVAGPSPATTSAYCAQRVAAGTQLTPADPTPPHSAFSSSLYPLAAATNPFAMQLPSVAPTALPAAAAPTATAAPPASVAAPAIASHGVAAAPYAIPPGGPRMRTAGGMARTGGALSVGPADAVLPVQPSVGVHGGMAGTGVNAQVAVEEAARVTPRTDPEEHRGPAPMDVEEGKSESVEK
ncbi:unnamed protein product [Closterium sp. Naga37s-1]|nr:unnamed protein product [Closterium sp. Naga37s-1]